MPNEVRITKIYTSKAPMGQSPHAPGAHENTPSRFYRFRAKKHLEVPEATKPYTVYSPLSAAGGCGERNRRK